MGRRARRDQAAEALTDGALALAGFGGPGAALLLPRLSLLGLKPMSVRGLRRAWRLRWVSLAASTAALGALFQRRRGGARRAALAADALSLGALLAISARLYRAELGFTKARARIHVRPPAAKGLLHDEAQVAGLQLGGRAIAYPLARLAAVRPFVDELGGVRVVPLADRQSHAAVALVSSAQGPALDLIRLGARDGSVLVYDRARKNAFRPLAGWVEAGPNEGAPLELRPLARCTFAAWKKLHPDTLLAWWDARPAHRVLGFLGEHELTVRHLEDAHLQTPVDGRLQPAEQIFAAAVDGEAHAFTRRFLLGAHVTPLTLHGRPVVTLYDAALDIAQAYFAELDGAPLPLWPYHGLHAVARDSRGDLWDVAGRCIRGSRYGRQLVPVPLSVDRVYWFAWSALHPHCGLDAWPARTATPSRAAEGD